MSYVSDYCGKSNRDQVGRVNPEESSEEVMFPHGPALNRLGIVYAEPADQKEKQYGIAKKRRGDG